MNLIWSLVGLTNCECWILKCLGPGAVPQKHQQKPWLSILNSSFFSVSCHLGQQTEGSIWCMDPKHVTLCCARTSVLPGAGTADQLAKQVCQCVKIPANSFPRFLEYYTTSFNSKAFCPCKLPALWSELTMLTTKHKLFLQSTPGSPKRCPKSMAWSFWNLGKHKAK